MADPEFQEDYDDTLTLPPSVIENANPGVPRENLFGARAKSSLDQMVERLPGVASENAGALKNKMASDEAIRGKYEGYRDEDRSRMVKAWDAMGVEADKIQPWDQDKAREKYRTDPIESFGSLGSVFAMIASAFTHAPMTNALNASAAAMNAIKEGNEAEYEKAFRAFKENNDLAVKRHAMMSTQYNAAATLMDKDMAAGRDALMQNAAKFGDQRLLTLLNAGYDKEALEYVSSLTRLTRDHTLLSGDIDRTTFQRDALDKALKNNEQIPDPKMRQLANERDFARIMFNKEFSPPQMLAEIIMAQNRGASADQLGELFNKYHLMPRTGSNAASLAEKKLDTYMEEVSAEHPDWSRGQVMAEADRRMAQNRSVAGTKPAEERRKEILEDVKREHPEMTPGQRDLEVDRRLKQAGNVITANLRTKEQEKIDKLGFAIETMDKIQKPIMTKLGPVGAPAYATRLLERVGNFVGGTKSSDYVQLQRDINLLKAWAPQNLLGRDGRPLSAEHGQMNSIIAGLSLGDTVANTLRAYKDLRALYVKIQQASVKRLEGEWKPPGTEPTEPPGPRRSGNFKPMPWLDGTVVNSGR